MSNLKLITTEKFGEVDCNFYRNMNNDILLTREQIGDALEYANPQKAIQKIHLRHKDRLEPLCMRTKIQIGGNLTKSEEQERIYYSQRGIMEICRWSRQPKANQFMDWAWNIIDSYRNGELNNTIDIKPISDSLNKIVTLLESQEIRITKLEESNQTQSQPALTTTYKKPFNPWFKKMSPKYSLMEEYFNVTRGQLYRNILNELENLYDIDTSQIQADYLYENNLTSCYPLEPYEYNPKYRDMIEQIINSNLIKYRIASENDPITSTKHITIFDSPVKTDIKENELYLNKEITH